jgi:hypothetical protein
MPRTGDGSKLARHSPIPSDAFTAARKNGMIDTRIGTMNRRDFLIAPSRKRRPRPAFHAGVVT